MKANPAAALRESGSSLADQARRSGVGHMSDTERATLRAYLATLAPAKRLREAYGHADRANETAVDEVWTVLGREPSTEEYREMASMFRKAAKSLDADAKRVGK